MTRLSEIEGHITSIGELLDIVGAMRSLAGMRLRQAQHALPGIRRYAASMAEAIAAAILLSPGPGPETGRGQRRRALVFCASEHGFVGGFNERLMESLEQTFSRDDALFVLGSRGVLLAQERGWKPAWTGPMATRLSAATETVQRLTSELYARIAVGEISRIEVVFSSYRQGTAPVIERRLLLPLDVNALKDGQPKDAPLHNLEPQALLEKLLAEFVFALLTEAVAESIGSENAARFAAMTSAYDNVSTKLDELRQSARQARQGEITEELLDLVSGAEASMSL